MIIINLLRLVYKKTNFDRNKPNQTKKKKLKKYTVVSAQTLKKKKKLSGALKYSRDITLKIRS